MCEIGKRSLDEILKVKKNPVSNLENLKYEKRKLIF